MNEGVLATFEPGRGDGGTLFVQQGGAYSSTPPSGLLRQDVPCQRAAADRDCRGALRQTRAHARQEGARHRSAGCAEYVPGQPAGIQRPRGTAGHRQSRRDRDARRPLRLVARGHGRHRQRGRLRDHPRGDAHSEGLRSPDAPHGAPGALERRGAGAARLAGVREGQTSATARRWRSNPSTPGLRPTSTWTTEPAPSVACICRATRPSPPSSAPG